MNVTVRQYETVVFSVLVKQISYILYTPHQNNVKVDVNPDPLH